MGLILLLIGVFPQARLSKADDLKTDDLKASKLQTNNLKSSKLKASNLQTNNLKADNSKSSKLKSNKLQASKLQTNNLKSSKLKASNLQTNNLKADNSKSSKLKSNKLQASKLQTNNLKADNSKSSKLQTNNLKATDLKADNSKSSKLKSNKLQASKESLSSKKDWKTKFVPADVVNPSFVNPGPLPDEALARDAVPREGRNISTYMKEIPAFAGMTVGRDANPPSANKVSIGEKRNPARDAVPPSARNEARYRDKVYSARDEVPSGGLPARVAVPSSARNEASYKDKVRPVRVADPTSAGNEAPYRNKVRSARGVAPPKRKVFRWLVGPSAGPADPKGKQNISFEYAQGFFTKETPDYPKLIKSKESLIKEKESSTLFYDNNSKNHSFYFNLQQDLFQFPYILNWGVRVSAGFFPYEGILNPQQSNSSEEEETKAEETKAEETKATDKNPQTAKATAKATEATATDKNSQTAKATDKDLFTKEDNSSDSFFSLRGAFFPLSASFIWSLQIFNYYTFTPFFEIGASVWNQGFYNKWSSFFPYWGAGAFISFSLLKNSLRYTFPEEYKIQDMGILLEMRRYLTPAKEDGIKSFLTTFHAGIYFHF